MFYIIAPQPFYRNSPVRKNDLPKASLSLSETLSKSYCQKCPSEFQPYLQPNTSSSSTSQRSISKSKWLAISRKTALPFGEFPHQESLSHSFGTGPDDTWPYKLHGLFFSCSCSHSIGTSFKRYRTKPTSHRKNADLALSNSGQRPEHSSAFFLKPASVDFGEVPVGLGASKNVCIKNEADASLHISAISYSGDPEFEVPTLTTPFEIGPWTDQVMIINFFPQDYRNYSGSITIYSNAPNDPVIRVEVQGVGSSLEDEEEDW
jgi:hypothetical protein